MVRRLQYRRLLMLGLVLAAAFAGLGYRLVDLQVIRHDELKKEAESLTRHVYRLEPRRGDILDVKGNLLATSVFMKTVCANPSLVSNRWSEIAHALAPLLQTNEAYLAQRLQRTRQNDKGETMPAEYVVLKRDVPTDVWEKVRDTMSKLPLGVEDKKVAKFHRDLRTEAVFADPVDDQVRSYPNQRLAAHVLGLTGTSERTNNGVRLLENVGVDGIEKTLDDKLKGTRGWRVTERDSHRLEMVALRAEDVEPHDGLDVVLTIDSVIQNIVQTALADGMEKNSPISISGIVIRPRTGEILALACLPDFDPNNPGAFPEDARRNRVIADIAEPGSTFKIVVVSGALNDGIVKLSDQFDCGHGAFEYAGKVLHDHEVYDVLSVENIITKSSNIGAAKIGIKLGEQRLHDFICDFGFGNRTGIPLPGEVRGKVHPVREWSKVSIAQIPMGQGVAVTSLQMAMAMSAIANHGVLMQPMLVDRLVDQDGTVVARYSPKQVRRVITEEADRDMVEALKTVITGDGTAAKAALEHYTVAGKTGTANKAEGGKYVNDKFYSSFVGFFPADNPEICIYVSLDEPRGGHYGGQVAAPIFKQIAEKAANYLNIRPDKTAEPAVPETTAATGAIVPVKMPVHAP